MMVKFPINPRCQASIARKGTKGAERAQHGMKRTRKGMACNEMHRKCVYEHLFVRTMFAIFPNEPRMTIKAYGRSYERLY